MNHALQHQSPIRATQDRLAGALRMRHETGDIPFLVADAGNAVERTVRIGVFGGFAPGIHIAPKDLVVRFKAGQCLFVRKVAAFAVGNRQAHELVWRIRLVNGESVVAVFRKMCSQRNWSERLRISAPGNSPASQRIWKPLQMPSTSPPLAANPCTASITGLNLAMAPVRR